MGFALIVTGLADLVSELGLGPAIIQKQDIDSKDLDTVFCTALAINSVLTAVIWAISPIVANFFEQPKVIPVLRAMSLMFIISAVRIVPWNLLTKAINFKSRSIAEVGANIAGALSTLGLAFGQQGVWALVAGVLVRQSFMTISSYWLHPWMPHFHFNRERLKQMLPFGASVSIGRFLYFIYSNADYFVVGKFLGQTLLGIYTLAFQLTMMVADRISNIINNIGFPVYSKLQDDPQRAKRFFLKSVELISLVTSPILVGMFLVADVAIPLVLSPKWFGVIAPFRIMCWTGLLISIGASQATVVVSKGRPDLNIKFSSLPASIIMPAAFWYGTRFGIVGVCWVWVTVYPLILAMYYIRTRKVVGYEWRELGGALLPAACCSLVMFICVTLTKLVMKASVLGLLVFILVGIVSYAGTLWLFFKHTLADVRSILPAKFTRKNVN